MPGALQLAVVRGACYQQHLSDLFRLLRLPVHSTRPDASFARIATEPQWGLLHLHGRIRGRTQAKLERFIDKLESLGSNANSRTQEPCLPLCMAQGELALLLRKLGPHAMIKQMCTDFATCLPELPETCNRVQSLPWVAKAPNFPLCLSSLSFLLLLRL